MAGQRREPRRPHRRVVAALLVVVGLLTTSACAPGGNAPTSTSAPVKTLVIGATAEPATMDPTAGPAAAVPQVMLYNVYETLVKMDGEGQLKPLLAQGWDLSDDRTVYTFHLNPAARFASGAKVTAEAVAQNISRMRATSVEPYRTQMSIITDQRVIDEDTLEVTLSRPSNLWLYDMSSTAGMVIDPAGFASLGQQTAGSGPLRLKAWTPRDNVTLERNPDYWGTPVRFDTVTFKYFADPNAMNAAMLSGQLDIISNLQAPDAIGQFSDPAAFTIVEGTTNGEVVLGLNNESPELSDVRVRRAISMAIDKQKLLETVWNGKGTLTGSMTVPTDVYHEDLGDVSPYDPDAARELLKEAKATDLELRFRPAALPYATKAAQFVASQLDDVGIDTTVEELQFPARWVDTIYTKGDYDLTIVAHVEARDIVNFANPDYYWHYGDKEFVDLVRAADRAAPVEFPDRMKAAARYLAEDAAAVWLFVLPNLVITKPTVSGVATNATSLSFDVTTIATR